MIKLQKFTEADFDQLIEWINTPELLTDWAGNIFSFPLTKSALEWYIDGANIAGESDAFIYKAVEEISGKTIGHISLGSISYTNSYARITRVFLAPAMQGKGLCKLIIRQLLSIAFEELHFHRVYLGVYTDNAAAIKCYEQAGLKREGINRDILKTETGYRSMLEMSILEDEWQG